MGRLVIEYGDGATYLGSLLLAVTWTVLVVAYWRWKR